MRKALVITIIVGLVALAGVLEIKRQAVTAQLQQLTVQLQQQPGNQQNQELAGKIITEVRLLIDIPEDVQPTVATIVDVDALREQNSFYDKAENGDHLVVTPTRAILYRPGEKKIIDVVPVQLEQQPPAAGEEKVEGSQGE